MRKYLYTTLFLTLLAQGGVMDKIAIPAKVGSSESERHILYRNKNGNYTFKDGSVYTGEMKGLQTERKRENGL